MLLRVVLIPLLPKHEEFDVVLPTGARISLGYRERIGRRLILQGSFEDKEIEAASEFATPGTTAIDVGANVGVFTLVLSSFVGPKGRVIAVEPLPDNQRRLQRHLATNNVANVLVEEAAIGSGDGQAEMLPDTDPAFAMAKPLVSTSAAGAIVVPMVSLDTIWTRAGCPLVSYVKIDVEGNEAAALTGATKLITQCRPVIMAEANSNERLRELEALIHPFRYVTTQRSGFEPWNFLFQPQMTSEAHR